MAKTKILACQFEFSKKRSSERGSQFVVPERNFYRHGNDQEIEIKQLFRTPMSI